MVFNEEEDDREQRGGRGKETSIAHDEDDIPVDDDEEGVEADYDEVLKSGVSKRALHYSTVQYSTVHGTFTFRLSLGSMRKVNITLATLTPEDVWP